MEENPSGKLSAHHKRWSSLPDDILSNIISRLDLPQNSIITISDTTFDINLSNKIKNMSETIPILDNLFTIFTTPLLNTVGLHLHHDSYKNPSLCRFIDSWARRLRYCDIEHLKIASNDSLFRNGGQVHAPNVFQIESLVSLDLDLEICGFAWNFPDSINFPNLKKLSLIFVNVKCIEMFMSSTPSLEDLSFTLNKKYGSLDGSLNIAGKNLTRLCIKLHGFNSFKDFTDLDLHVDAPKLDHFNFNAPQLLSLRHDQIIRQLIDSISHVKSLVLDIANDATIPYNIPNSESIFRNVTHLTWTMWRFERLETLCLLLPCPNLEVLVLNFVGFNNVDVIPEANFKLYENMKRLELNTGMVRFDERLLKLAKYFLTIALSLEKLVLRASVSYLENNYHLEEAARFHRNLLDCPRCSSSLCEVEFLGAYQSLIYPTNFDSA